MSDTATDEQMFIHTLSNLLRLDKEKKSILTTSAFLYLSGYLAGKNNAPLKVITKNIEEILEEVE